MSYTIEFDVNSVKKITFRELKETDHKWFPATPEKRSFFGLIVTEQARPAGWSTYETGIYRRTTEELNAYCQYIVDEKDMCVYSAAHVEVILDYKLSVSRCFASNAEAIDWIETIKTASDKTFDCFQID
jgi:hypothetical protein